MHSPKEEDRIKPGEISCKLCQEEIREEFILIDGSYGQPSSSGEYRKVGLEYLCNRDLDWVHFECFVEENGISEEIAGDIKIEDSVDFCDSCGLSFGQNDGYSCQSCEIFIPRFCPECHCLEDLGIKVFLCDYCHDDVKTAKRPFVVEYEEGHLHKLNFTE